MSGNLYLLPSPIAENTIGSFSPDLLYLYKTLRYFVVENVRTTRRWLKQIDRNINIDDLTFIELNKQADVGRLRKVITILQNGEDAGVVSEAGCPGIADPGSRLVAMAHEKDIQVIPVSGPSSIYMALMASGLNGQSFSFHGYLPIKKNELVKKLVVILKSLEMTGYSQIFMEAPYRNNALFQRLLEQIPKTIRLTVACEIGSLNTLIKTKTIEQWRAQSFPDLHKRPTIFILGK